MAVVARYLLRGGRRLMNRMGRRDTGVGILGAFLLEACVLAGVPNDFDGFFFTGPTTDLLWVS